jgi:hypothetical protein
MSEQSRSIPTQIRNAQKTAAKNAANRGGLVLGADQAHAFTMSSMLNKIKGIDDLSDNNYTSWSKQVMGQMNSIFFDSYLTDVHYEDYEVEDTINRINRNCILEFLFSKMDETNAARFRAGLLDVKIPLVREMIPPTDEELEADPEAQPTPGRLVPSMGRRPGHLWAIVKEFHQSDNEANIYLLQNKIEQFRQDYKTSISTHLDEFSKLKNEFFNRGGHIDESLLGRRLLHSIHNTHIAEIRHILRTVKPITTQTVTAALKRYEDENKEFQLNSGGKISEGINNLKLASNTTKSGHPPPKCTLTKCLGPHPAARERQGRKRMVRKERIDTTESTSKRCKRTRIRTTHSRKPHLNQNCLRSTEEAEKLCLRSLR